MCNARPCDDARAFNARIRGKKEGSNEESKERTSGRNKKFVDMEGA